MICPGCNNKHTIHAYANTADPPCAKWPRCNRCGDAYEPNASNTRGSWKAIRLELGLCDICAIGEERARAYTSGKKSNMLIIDGYTYSAEKQHCVPLGAPDPCPTARWRGMAGRRFDIQRLDGSAPFSCYSLWGGGPIDKYCRDRMPDNARFLNGAARYQVGETTGFNSSTGKAI